MIAKVLLLARATMAFRLPAHAGQKVAVFPVELDYQPSEEDFYIGERKVAPEEQARLEMVHKEFISRLSADSRYEVVDLTPLAAEITEKQPLHSCNDCETDLARKVGAELTFTAVVDKISETHLNLIVTMRDVATGAVVRNHQVVIQGNTDETWMHGARWVLKNRILVEGKG